MPDITMHTHGMGHLGHISTNPFADPMAGTPEQHFANHLQDHYGMQMQNYSQHNLAQHANHFAMHHCGGNHEALMQLTNMVQTLMAELSLLKTGMPPGGGPEHNALLEASDRMTQKQLAQEAHIRHNEDLLAASQLESKMAKKMRDNILQSI